MEIKQCKNKFYIGENPESCIAEITFVPKDEDRIIVDHTYVSDSLRGQGIGGELVKKVIEYAEKEDKKIIPACTYAAKLMTENEEYKKYLC